MSNYKAIQSGSDQHLNDSDGKYNESNAEKFCRE